MHAPGLPPWHRTLCNELEESPQELGRLVKKKDENTMITVQLFTHNCHAQTHTHSTHSSNTPCSYLCPTHTCTHVPILDLRAHTSLAPTICERGEVTDLQWEVVGMGTVLRVMVPCPESMFSVTDCPASNPGNKTQEPASPKPGEKKS